MIVECKHCGAPLDVERGSAFARCSYCGHTNKVKSAKTLLAESPIGWQPPPTWQPPPQYRAPQVPLPYSPGPAPKARAGCGAPLFGLVLTAAIAGVVAFGNGAFSGLPFFGPDLEGAPTVATVELASLASAGPLQGEAGGSLAASGLGTGCQGHLPRAPQLVLRAHEPVHVRIGTQTGSNTDLVMAIRTADGRWLCDDDSGGSRMPLITATLAPGDHRVWVGTFTRGESAPFTFTLQGGPGGGPDGLAPEATPLIGEVTLGAEAVRATWPGTTTGWVEASPVGGPRCRGWIPAAPHLRLDANAPRRVRIETSDNGGTDLVMLVRSPSGRVECDDDSGGSLNPRIDTTLEPGRTNVWIGSYHQDQSSSFQVTLSDRDGGGATGGAARSLNLDLPDWQGAHAGTVRAQQQARAIGARCAGYVGEGPDFAISTTAPRELELAARGARNLRIVVRGPDGAITCIEGQRGADPSLRRSWTPGIHHVWIGSSRRETLSYELVLSPAR